VERIGDGRAPPRLPIQSRRSFISSDLFRKCVAFHPVLLSKREYSISILDTISSDHPDKDGMYHFWQEPEFQIRRSYIGIAPKEYEQTPAITCTASAKRQVDVCKVSLVRGVTRRSEELRGWGDDTR